jgi:predicted RNA-binding Zn-ribbon protein involved in translation (DUF1610 family)
MRMRVTDIDIMPQELLAMVRENMNRNPGAQTNSIVEPQAILGQISYDYEVEISCPECGWKPKPGSKWACDNCRTEWNTFNTNGLCPKCGHSHHVTGCPDCGRVTERRRWYSHIIRAR